MEESTVVMVFVGGKTSCSECSATGRREALGRQVIIF